MCPESHRITRNNNCSLQIPKTKLKYAKKKKSGFLSIGVTLYNKLPDKTRKIKNFNAFRKDIFSLYM